MRRNIYKNPPITEAVVELQIHQTPDWDPRLMGAFYDSIKERCDGQPQLELAAVPVTTQFGLQTQQTMQARFPSFEGSNVVLLRHTSVSAHELPPYQGWTEHFRDFAHFSFSALNNVDSLNVVHASVRYINTITLPLADLRPSDYIAVTPPIAEGLPKQMISLVHQTQLHDPREDAVVGIVIGMQQPMPQDTEAQFLLDIQASHTFSNPVGLQDALTKVDALRALERNCFEACITDKLRHRFGWENADEN